jgi:hypothetical protein
MPRILSGKVFAQIRQARPKFCPISRNNTPEIPAIVSAFPPFRL